MSKNQQNPITVALCLRLLSRGGRIIRIRTTQHCSDKFRRTARSGHTPLRGAWIRFRASSQSEKKLKVRTWQSNAKPQRDFFLPLCGPAMTLHTPPPKQICSKFLKKINKNQINLEALNPIGGYICLFVWLVGVCRRRFNYCI